MFWRKTTTIHSLGWSPGVLSCATLTSIQVECTAFWLSPWRDKEPCPTYFSVNLAANSTWGRKAWLVLWQRGAGRAVHKAPSEAMASPCWVGVPGMGLWGLAQEHPWAWEAERTLSVIRRGSLTWAQSLPGLEVGTSTCHHHGVSGALEPEQDWEAWNGSWKGLQTLLSPIHIV